MCIQKYWAVNMKHTLTTARALWVLFILFALQSIAFQTVEAHRDLTLIDRIGDPEQIRQTISSMNAMQRQVHIWTTATLDVLYPLTYGLLFAGLSLSQFRRFWALPAMIVIPIDLLEGVVQMILLLGNDHWIGLKAILTSTKFVFFALAALIALAALMVGIMARLSQAYRT